MLEKPIKQVTLFDTVVVACANLIKREERFGIVVSKARKRGELPLERFLVEHGKGDLVLVRASVSLGYEVDFVFSRSPSIDFAISSQQFEVNNVFNTVPYVGCAAAE